MLDHVLALTFAIGFPAVTGPIYLRRRAAMLAGDPAVRRREYLETTAWLASMGAATLAVWWVQGRDFADLGLGVAVSIRHAGALALASVVGVLLSIQARAVKRDAATREAARASLQSVREYLPRNADELRLFRGLSLSAGIGEELFYRGFLIWYLGLAVPVPLAVVISSLLFGVAHYMHGGQAALRATVMGFLLAGLYLLGGSLWAPILLHMAVDLSSGEMGLAAFGTRRGKKPVDEVDEPSSEPPTHARKDRAP